MYKWMLVLVFSMAAAHASAQGWMEGYNYRKHIEVQKDRVPGNVNLPDFTVMISLTDPDLKFIAGQCAANKVSGRGLDISFALASAPAEAIPFQLERFDPATGTLTCWVRLPALAASGAAGDKTALFLYYGSNLIHDPYGSAAVGTWPGNLARRWHMNLDVLPAGVWDVKSKLHEGMLVGSSEMNASNFVPGKLGTAIQLDGSSEFLSAARDTSNNLTISFWVRFDRVDKEQVILTNDSARLGGYTIKLNAGGKLMFDTKSGTIPLSLSGNATMLPKVWYFVCFTGDSKQRGIYINGKASIATSKSQAIGRGGTITVGRSKQKDKYFGGCIDELSVVSGIRSADWIAAEYNNQNDPAQFFSVGNEQQNAVITPRGDVFNGAVNDQWNEPGNWDALMVPQPYANVRVKAGVHLRLVNVADVMIGQLTLDSAAALTLTNGLEVICSTSIAKDGLLQLVGDARLQLDGDLLNHGSIRSEDLSGTLTFSGHEAQLHISGTGNVRVYRLQNDLAAADGMVNVGQPVVVTGMVRVISGVLNSAGNLTLAAEKDRAASLITIGNLAGAAVIGVVQVEKYVSGGFSAPATARGWRLSSSPVYAAAANGTEVYNLVALKEAAFVTGKGGAAKGFDSSPQNGNTIYTHDPEIVGSLSQKYVPIPDMETSVALGKGFYMYSRGSRHVPDAFRDQVQVAPFSNPEPYTITYKGQLFMGALQVDLLNRNQGESGDGFNLLGNPYAAPVRWGSLLKENVGEYAWTFNPLNNAYDVTDDPDLVIPAADGFFVKVNSGAARGSLTFDEGAKVSEEALNEAGAAAPLSSRLSAVSAVPRKSTTLSSVGLEELRRLDVTLSGGVFSQRYVLKLHPRLSDATTDEDAASVGEGFVNVAGLGINDEKLAIDGRELQQEDKSVRLFVKVWSGGRYVLGFSGLSNFVPRFSVVLVDKLLKTETPLNTSNTQYSFDVDVNAPESQGADRFKLLIRPQPLSAADGSPGDPILIYPNPFREVLNMKAVGGFPAMVGVQIRDLLGRLVLRTDILVTAPTAPISFNTSMLKSGLYIIEIMDAQLHKRIQTAKIIKL